MRAVLVCLALCLAVASAQLQFTANFEMRHPFMQGGVVNGQIAYSWSERAYKLTYTTQGYEEIYTFNPARGYAPIDVTDRPFHNQWTYKSGRTCACETGPNDVAMPQLFIDASVASNFTAGATVSVLVGGSSVSAVEYTRKAGTPGDVEKIYIANNRIVRAVFADFREFTFTNLATSAVAASVFTPPANCKCGQPVDIAIVLDRSGSISHTEFGRQHDFVEGFTEAFAFGPLGANLAIVHFNTPAWVSLHMNQGVSDSNVRTGVESIVCCNDDGGNNACCCCGTSISSGMRLGADELAGGRARVEKVLLVITDGYHNTDYKGKSCSQASDTCRDDLRAATAYAKATVPGVKIYAVGVGEDRDISQDELLIIADGVQERVMTYSDFGSLAQNSLDLVARACQENLNPCGGCCGFCVCGQCTAPDACDSGAACMDNAIPQGGVCCQETPRDCSDGDKCTTDACDTATNACTHTPVGCKSNTTCYGYSCSADTGLCVTDIKCTTEPECLNDDACDDGNACTRDICNQVTQLCTWEDSSATCDDGNACTIDTCDTTLGCVHSDVPEDYCDDQSVCTTDTCDPASGCIHTNIECADENLCTDDTCDPFKGCLNTPRVCPNDGKDKCKLFFCLNGTCDSRKSDGCGAPVVAVAAALSTAAIIGIIVGVVLCVAGVGAGGAYAYSQAAGAGSVAPVANNPIYVGSGAQGTNPLYRE